MELNILEKEIADSKIPVLVDFFAEWCGPCKIMEPTMKKLEKELEGKVKFITIDVDENRELAEHFVVLSIPKLMLFKDGKKVLELVGTQSESDLRKSLA